MKMIITRRNWLLRCSILANIAVLLYICSHVMIGGGNFSVQPAPFVLQQQQQQQQQLQQTSDDQSAAYSSSSSTSSRGNSNVGQQDAPVLTSRQTKNSVEAMLNQDVQGPELRIGDILRALPQQMQQLSNSLLNSVNSNNNNNNDVDSNDVEDESRFDVPTDETKSQQKRPVDELAEQSQDSGNAVTLNNNSNLNNISENDLEARLRSILNCNDRDYTHDIGQRGDFWVLKNFVKAEHGDLRCHETITYTTHADYSFLDNLPQLMERWNAPISIALHAPGTDFQPTLNSIKFLRECIPESSSIRQFVTFHIYFSSKHVPKTVPKFDKALTPPINCSLPPPYVNVSSGQLYKSQKKLLYPVNVGRNIARDAALTHFILASDIELYPVPNGLVHKFLEMIARNDPPLQRKAPRVFPLSLFEVDSTVSVPKDKTELQELLRTGKAIPFHKRVCAACHGVPKSKEWMAANETDDLGVFHIGKRLGYFIHWEPIYIGTHADPHYDERLSWEGKSDKMTQGYALCALDYEFHILDNGFLVHKPGIKVLKKDPKRAMLAGKTNQLIKKIIYPELQALYGTRKGCAV